MSVAYNLKLALKKLLPREFILATHKLRAVLAAFYFGFPARKLRVIGVGGTKGKTTTTNLITRILEEAGFKVAMFSTANTRLSGEESLNMVKLTTPSPFFLQKFLRKAIIKKCDFAVIEVSSHALVQHRLYGIDFKTVVITNLMPDHLDYHKNADEYRDTHLKIIGPKTEAVIVNGEDEESSILRRRLAASEDKQKIKFKIFSFGLEGNNDLRGYDIQLASGDVKFKVEYQNKDLGSPREIPRSSPRWSFGEAGGNFASGEIISLGEFVLNIPGKFNVYNALAAIGTGMHLGIEPEKIRKALEKVSGVPGRLENIKVSDKQDFQVIVDYAHSPDSLKNVYEAVKPYVKGRLIAVLGGTGDRDKTYRAKCGALADSFADIVIVTNEDPYSEDPEDIMDQVLEGIKNKVLDSPREIPQSSPRWSFGEAGGNSAKDGIISRGKTLFRILDRKEAIKKAIDLAKKDDIILITGKGSEQFMVWGDKMIPWDDREKAREALKERFKV